MRLGIDLDGVVANFNDGWIRRYNSDFGASVVPESVAAWDGIIEATHFPSMSEFWHWARDVGDGSIFRHLDPYPGSMTALQELAVRGHHLVILTTKPPWAVHDTFAWLSEHRLPTREVHILEDKWTVACDLYLDDAPHILQGCLQHRPEAVVVRFIRPWNRPMAGVVDVADWEEFPQLVQRLQSGAPQHPH